MTKLNAIDRLAYMNNMAILDERLTHLGIVEASDNEGCDIVLVLAQIPESKLLHKALGEAFLDGEGIVLRPFILAVVVDPQLVVRNRVIILEFG